MWYIANGTHNNSKQQRHKAHEPEKTYVKLHSHKLEGRTHKSQTHTKQATRSCKTMLSKVEQLLKIFCPPLNALNLN